MLTNTCKLCSARRKKGAVWLWVTDGMAGFCHSYFMRVCAQFFQAKASKVFQSTCSQRCPNTLAKQLMLINIMQSVSSITGQNFKEIFWNCLFLSPRWKDIWCCSSENLDIRHKMWQLVEAFRCVCKIPIIPPLYNISTERKWGGISFCKREGENIKCNFTGYLDGSWADNSLSAAARLFGPFSIFFFPIEKIKRQKNCNVIEETWDSVLFDSLCSESILSVQEAVACWTTDTTNCLAFVFSTLCRQQCTEAFFTSLI